MSLLKCRDIFLADKAWHKREHKFFARPICCKLSPARPCYVHFADSSTETAMIEGNINVTAPTTLQKKWVWYGLMSALLDVGDSLVDLESFCDRCAAFSAQSVELEAKTIKVTRYVSKFCGK